MAGTLMPLGKLQVLDNNGLPAAGYQLFTYESGTTTKLSTYSDSALTVPNTNPIILDASGRATVFVGAAAYKQVLAPPTDSDPPTTPLWTVDGIPGTASTVNNLDLEGVAGEALTAGQVCYMSDGSGGLTAGQWYLTDSDHNYSSVDAPTRGIVTVDTAAGNTGTFRVQGRYVMGGAMSQGAVYYIDAVAGTLNTSDVQQNRCPFGQADTTTSIVFPITGTISISIKQALMTFAYGGAIVPGTNANSAGGGDTELTSYEVSVPDNFLDTPGAALVLQGTLVLAANGNTKTMKISLGASGVLTVFSTAENLANNRGIFRLILFRRSATGGALTGLVTHGSQQTDGANTYVSNHVLTGTVDWTIAQALKIFLVGTNNSDIFLTDYYVYQLRSPYGAIV